MFNQSATDGYVGHCPGFTMLNSASLDILRHDFGLLYYYFLRIHFQIQNDRVQRYAMFYILMCIANCTTIILCQDLILAVACKSPESLISSRMT